MKRLFILMLSLLILTLTACESNIAGRGYDDEGNDVYELPLPEFIPGSTTPGSLGSMVGNKACELVDGDGFGAAGCHAGSSCPSNSWQLIKPGENNLCSEGAVCCIQKNPYVGYDDDYNELFGCWPDCDDGGLVLTVYPDMEPYWDSWELWWNDICTNPWNNGDHGMCNYDVEINDWDDCQDPDLHFVQCIDRHFFCNHYLDAYCVDDYFCNRNSYGSCMNDPDCWPDDASEQQKDNLCRNSCIAHEQISTCIKRDDNTGAICPSNTFDFQGEVRQRGYYGAYTKAGEPLDDRYGCSAFDNTLYGDIPYGGAIYDCCFYRIEETPLFVGTEEHEKAFAFDSLFFYNSQIGMPNAYQGYVNDQQVWITDARIPQMKMDISLYWQGDIPDAPYLHSGDYWCEGTQCMESDGGLRSLDEYERCWECQGRCGEDECCDGIDNDGDGGIDKNDNKCPQFIGLEEGGVCFD